jgi:hypothetical protein
MPLELGCTNPQVMFSLFIRISDRVDRFAQWFNARFGWFFTNGMKDRRPPRESGIKA